MCGGSGITPVMSILRDLDRARRHRAMSFSSIMRAVATTSIFGGELERLAKRHPGLRLILCLDDAANGGFDEARLAAAVPDFAERATFLCGPPGLMERVERMWHDAGASARLPRERFAAPPRKRATPRSDGDDGGAPAPRSPSRSRAPVAPSPSPPARRCSRRSSVPASGRRNGCRIGICHTCKCTKRAGTVENLLPAPSPSQPDEEIQLCISVPRSDVELGL